MTNRQPPKKDAAERKALTDLLDVMAALRTPGTGCPWDLEQDFASIVPYTIEEAYEVADAIERGDLVDLEDELGDLLLQVVYHARLAEEQGAFAFADVVHAITTKMIRRHPHVFGDAEARSSGVAKDWWERIKAQEKAEKAAARARLPGAATLDQGDVPVSAGAPARSRLSGVPLGLPALMRAVKLQDKAARVGFDWPGLGPVFDKMREEISELEAVALPADPRGAGQRHPESMARIAEEFGDLLFVMANVARHLAIDPEAALRGANAKFSRRFGYIEQRLADAGTHPEQATLQEMDRLWDEAKSREKS
jgi:ATP diphosphatase